MRYEFAKFWMKVVKDVAKNIRMLGVQQEISLRTLGTNMKLLRRMIRLFQKKYDKHGIICIIMNCEFILNTLLLQILLATKFQDYQFYTKLSPSF